MEPSVDLQDALGRDTFPFPTEPSLAPLVRFWTGDFGDDRSAKAAVARMIRDRAREAPEILAPLADPEVIERHRDAIDVLMAAVFPPAFWDRELGAAMVPFQLRAFYATPPARRLLLGPDGRLQGRVRLEPLAVARLRLAFAYALVLERLYGVRVDAEHTLIFTVADPDTGLDRHFKVNFDQRFLEVEAVGDLPPLPEAERARLAAGGLEPERLRALLPPERFRVRGFTVFRAVEVTDQDVVSSLERDLIDKESIVSQARFEALQAKLRVFFRRPDLGLGLAALEGDRVLVLNHGVRKDGACIFADTAHHKTSEFEGSIFQRAVQSGRPVVVDDLALFAGRTRIEDALLQTGARSLVIAPLHYQDRVIGTLELWSPHAGDITPAIVPKLEEVVPLFAVAVRRSMEELNTRVQAFIKEQCTAIHPVVEWRFRQAVLDCLERQPEGAGPGELGPIVFERVYPLYGLVDIRGSSTQRALAIQADLLAQLRRASQVVKAAYRARALPALDELAYRMDRHAARLERGLQAGDEVGTVAFLREDVEPLFDHLQGFSPVVREHVEAYRAALEPRLGTVYAERRRFEDSVTRLTEALSAYLDLEEQAAQAMIPHYFEKQKTDGVDYQIYVGASLLEDGRFDPLYLKSLRLWQLMVMCGLTLRAHQLRDHLPTPLETAQLVLVQHAPLAIRFRFDEKRFDVDGAYNIRYEIVKKRIDKAVARSGGERVTQPGKIAVVYGQPAEAQEYRRYVEYLQSLGYLTREVEDLELEPLQGMQGLRALRLTVDLSKPPRERPIAAGDLGAAVGAPAR